MTDHNAKVSKKVDGDIISRQAAIDALWKALYEYEDETERRFQESEDLDIGDWIEHRIFVQNMSDIDRKTIMELPSAQPEIIRCKDCKFYSPMNRETKTGICNLIMHQNFGDNWFCAGAERRTDENR